MSTSKKVVFKSKEIVNYDIAKLITSNMDNVIEQIPFYKDKNMQINLKKYVNSIKYDDRTDTHYIDVNYTYSKNMQPMQRGRLFTAGPSMQNLSAIIRNTILNDKYYDIDMQSSAINILRQYCAKKNYDCKYIDRSYKNNEIELKEIMEEKNIDRKSAKQIRLMAIYGGACKSKLGFMQKLIKNVNEIKTKMMTDTENAELLKIVRTSKEDANDDYNEDSRLLICVLNIIECDILMACVDFLKSKYISIKNIILIFDGFMILKSVFNPEIIEEMVDYVYKKTGYTPKFILKPTNEKLDLSKMTIKEEIIIDNDAEAAKILLDTKLKNIIYNCNGNIYVNNEKRVWSNNNTDVDRVIMTNAISCNMMKNGKKISFYSTNLTNLKAIVSLCRVLCDRRDNLIYEIMQKSKGKVFYRNGVYDFKIMKLREETEEDMTCVRIDRDYNENVNIETKKKVIELINSIFEKGKASGEKLGNASLNFLQHLSRGMAMDFQDKRFVQSVGERNSGKGIVTGMICETFGSYATTINTDEMLQKQKSNDEASSRKFIIPHMWSRLVVGNELTTDNSSSSNTLNGSLIKTLTSGGDIIKARELYRGEIAFIFHGRIFLFMNSCVEIKPADAMQNCSIFTMPCKYYDKVEYDEFDRKNQLKPFMRVKDPELKEKVKKNEYIDAFTQLVYENYTTGPVQDIKEVKKTLKLIQIENHDELIIYNEYLDFTDANAKTDVRDIYNFLKKDKLPNLSRQKLNQYMLMMNIQTKQLMINKRRASYYIGVKIKNGDEYNEEDNDGED